MAPGDVHTNVLQCREEFPVLQSAATRPEHLELRRSIHNCIVLAEG